MTRDPVSRVSSSFVLTPAAVSQLIGVVAGAGNGRQYRLGQVSVEINTGSIAAFICSDSRRINEWGVSVLRYVDCEGDNSAMDALSQIELTAEVVSAFVGNNSVPRGELSALIQSVHQTLTRLGDGAANAAPVIVPKEPAVSIRKSITPDYLICLEDGRKFKSLRRHLATLGLTPEQYRNKWKLSDEYPMVAPSYAATRSALAKRIGLGRKRLGTPGADLAVAGA